MEDDDLSSCNDNDDAAPSLADVDEPAMSLIHVDEPIIIDSGKIIYCSKRISNRLKVHNNKEDFKSNEKCTVAFQRKENWTSPRYYKGKLCMTGSARQLSFPFDVP